MDTLNIDISEEDIYKFDKAILNILLKDRTTQKNIIWATNDYFLHGEQFYSTQEIKVKLITKDLNNIISPRITKEQYQKDSRTKLKAEVFTPSWICNIQNNLIDNEWFGINNVFNIEEGKIWHTKTENINFSKYKNTNWMEYVGLIKLEVSCGEAPYIVSRYDTVTGEYINVTHRIGFLDRKLRIINENVDEFSEWFEWVIKAFQSCYGFEFQGDSLLLARENLLFTFIDNMIYKFNRVPSIEEQKQIANIISWNIWQMDGITYSIPYSREKKKIVQLSLFEIEEPISEYLELEKNVCKIKDWKSDKIVEFKELLEGA